MAGGRRGTRQLVPRFDGPRMIVLLIALLRRGRGAAEMETEPPGDDPAARHAAAEAVQDAIEELEVGGDVRSVILACFRRFCALLGARGITAQDALTPRELELLAVERSEEHTS